MKFDSSLNYKKKYLLRKVHHFGALTNSKPKKEKRNRNSNWLPQKFVYLNIPHFFYVFVTLGNNHSNEEKSLPANGVFIARNKVVFMLNHLKDYFHQCYIKKRKKTKRKLTTKPKRYYQEQFSFEKTYYTLQGKKVFPFN